MIRRVACLAAFGLLLGACGQDAASSGGHSHDASGGHAGEEGGHDHGGPGSVVVTHFTDHSEVFVEYPPFAADARSPFALHLTELPSGRPIADGKAVVRMAGPAGEERWEAEPSATPGIFRPAPIPSTAGLHRLYIDIVQSDGVITHDLGEVMVYPTAAEADASLAAEADAGGVSFLKEQQWRVEFATAPVEIAPVSASVPARITVRGAPNGEAAIAAPVSGRIEAAGAFPHVGQDVRAGQVLFRMRPLGTEAAETASVAAASARAEADHAAALTDLARIERLYEQGAVSRRDLEQAQARVAAADGERQAARAGLASLSGVVRAPITGRISALSASPGETANAGDIIARVVNPKRLMIEARVSERDAGQLRGPSGLVIEPAGGAPILLAGEGVEVLGSGGAIDPVTRTVPVAFGVAGRDDLIVGMSTAGRVLVGEARDAPVIPRSALVDDAGQNVIYVLLDGETFERRVVRLGGTLGDRVEVVDGVTAGERVVSKGSYLVRLAEAGPASAGHGHAH